MAIQNRRGAYTNFDPTKLKPGEFAIVQSGDPDSTDGKAVYICTQTGTVLRLVSDLELTDYNSDAEAILEAVQQQGGNIQTVYQNTLAKANEASVSASSAQSSATSANADATTASTAATTASTAAEEAAADAEIAKAVNDSLSQVIESNNLFDPELMDGATVGGVTITRNDDAFTFNGTATSFGTCTSQEIPLVPGVKYTVKIYSSSTKRIEFYFLYTKSGGVIATSPIYNSLNTPSTLTIPNDVVSTRFCMGPINGTTYSNDTYKVSIEQGIKNEQYKRYNGLEFTAIDAKARGAMANISRFTDPNEDGNIVITLS